MKCFTYVYARLVLSELYTVLIIPNDFLERANPSADSSDEESITRPAALDNTSDNNSNYIRQATMLNPSDEEISGYNYPAVRRSAHALGYPLYYD